ncbi:hypothetical protein J6590_094365 [Homalodisca vitripennis]|nr:hypothetical protein J6590_094365 [Homalodisca vitripennis]
MEYRRTQQNSVEELPRKREDRRVDGPLTPKSIQFFLDRLPLVLLTQKSIEFSLDEEGSMYQDSSCWDPSIKSFIGPTETDVPSFESLGSFYQELSNKAVSLGQYIRDKDDVKSTSQPTAASAITTIHHSVDGLRRQTLKIIN